MRLFQIKRSLVFKISVISVLNFTQHTFAQVAKSEYVGRADMAKVFKQMNNWFINTTAYSVVVTHASYENHKTTTIADKAVGYFKKDKNNYHSFLIGIHTIQNKNYKIVIDTSERIMMVSNPDQLVWNTYTVNDYDSLLKICATIKVSSVGNDKLYRMDFKADNPIAWYEFLVNAEGLPKEIVWYYNQEVNKENDNENSEKIKPRVSISFSNYNSTPNFVYEAEFGENKYFLNTNDVLKASNIYTTYELYDQRIK